jgi:hypothetical protein
MEMRFTETEKNRSKIVTSLLASAILLTACAKNVPPQVAPQLNRSQTGEPTPSQTNSVPQPRPRPVEVQPVEPKPAEAVSTPAPTPSPTPDSAVAAAPAPAPSTGPAPQVSPAPAEPVPSASFEEFAPQKPQSPPKAPPAAAPKRVAVQPAETDDKIKLVPLAWETAAKPERKNWSEFTLKIVSEEFAKLDQVNDASLFCPQYSKLSKDEKINFWGMLIAEMALHESSWDPTSRMKEGSQGTDWVTGQPVYSEGLLQLSYQDISWAPYCEFDWNHDKNLSPRDPKKTILDPKKNLRCGIKILADQVASKKEIALKSDVYWAVLREGGEYSKIKEISADIKKRLEFCVK